MRGARAAGGFAVVWISLLALGACGDGLDRRTADPSALPVVERPQTPGSAQSSPGSVPPAPVGAAATVTVVPSRSPTPTGSPSSVPSQDPDSTAPDDPSQPTGDPPSGREQLEGAAVELTNAERADAGCPAVQVDERLREAARAHSEDMAERDFFDHENLDGDGPGDRARAAGYDWRAISENIAYGYPTAEDVVAGWMDSPGHRQNMLNCDVVDIGVGVADSDGGPYWTQMFGRS